LFIFYYFSFLSCPSCHAKIKHSTENNATKVMKTQKKNRSNQNEMKTTNMMTEISFEHTYLAFKIRYVLFELSYLYLFFLPISLITVWDIKFLPRHNGSELFLRENVFILNFSNYSWKTLKRVFRKKKRLCIWSQHRANLNLLIK
jgi:hypothetical protein